MAVLETKTRKTVADYMKLPDEVRVELFEGEFFMCPAPGLNHQRTVLNFASTLRARVRALGLGEVIVSPFDCILSDEVVVQPDVLFVAKEHLDRLQERLHGPPDLAIEVLSPTHAERDRIVKRDLYAKYGVREFWIADCETRTIEVYVLERGAYRLVGIFGVEDDLRSPILPDLRLAVREVFE